MAIKMRSSKRTWECPLSFLYFSSPCSSIPQLLKIFNTLSKYPSVLVSSLLAYSPLCKIPALKFPKKIFPSFLLFFLCSSPPALSPSQKTLLSSLAMKTSPELVSSSSKLSLPQMKNPLGISLFLTLSSLGSLSLSLSAAFSSFFSHLSKKYLPPLQPYPPLSALFLAYLSPNSNGDLPLQIPCSSFWKSTLPLAKGSFSPISTYLL